MRLFFAIDLPSDVKSSVKDQLESFRAEYPYFSYVMPQDYHLTLIFLGELDIDKWGDKKVSHVTSALYDIAPFHLYASGTSLFISQKITLYVTFVREKMLENLVTRLSQTFEIPEKKKYVPHMTFARYKIPSKQQYLLIKKKLEKIKIDASFVVDKIYLYESITNGLNQEYKKIAEFPLLA